MYKILIIEDDPLLRDSLSGIFASSLYQIFFETEGINGYKHASRERFDLILLDVLLPGKSGYLIAKQLRDNAIDTPVLMMSTKNELTDIITGFNQGCDGYICKPFNFIELKCRVDALLKRPPRNKSAIYHWGELIIDCNNSCIIKDKQELILPNKQYEIFKYLLENNERTVTKDELLNALWDYDSDTLVNTIDVHISKLRKHLKKSFNLNKELITTIHGKGYRLIK